VSSISAAQCMLVESFPFCNPDWTIQMNLSHYCLAGALLRKQV
jgi:hypothetical protein